MKALTYTERSHCHRCHLVLSQPHVRWVDPQTPYAPLGLCIKKGLQMCHPGRSPYWPPCCCCGHGQPFQSTTAPCALLSLHILMQGAWTLQHLITSFECASRKGFSCGIHGLAHTGMVATIKGFLPTHLALLVTSNLTTTL